eukprot:scaffold55433_cov84-Phaeocystis_antarctica.AAC.1
MEYHTRLGRGRAAHAPRYRVRCFTDRAPGKTRAATGAPAEQTRPGDTNDRAHDRHTRRARAWHRCRSPRDPGRWLADPRTVPARAPCSSGGGAREPAGAARIKGSLEQGLPRGRGQCASDPHACRPRHVVRDGRRCSCGCGGLKVYPALHAQPAWLRSDHQRSVGGGGLEVPTAHDAQPGPLPQHHQRGGGGGGLGVPATHDARAGWLR